MAFQKAGLTAIEEISKIWGPGKITDDVSRKITDDGSRKIMAYLEGLPHNRPDSLAEQPSQLSLYRSFQTFLEDQNWMDKAQQVLRAPGSKWHEVSPAVCIFRTDPGEVLHQLTHWKQSPMMQLCSKSTDLYIDDMKHMGRLKGLAASLEAWGRGMQSSEQSTQETHVVCISNPEIKHLRLTMRSTLSKIVPYL